MKRFVLLAALIAAGIGTQLAVAAAKPTTPAPAPAVDPSPAPAGAHDGKDCPFAAEALAF